MQFTLPVDFTAIDFETANFDASSACSIGVVRVEHGEITQTYSTLIRPPRLFFSSWCTAIHGLTAVDVRTAPTFDQVWNEALQEFLGNSVLVAHNAPFDSRVLRETLRYYHLQAPRNPWVCSCQTARKYFQYRHPDLPPPVNYKLNTLVDYFGFRFKHHDALEDAVAAARIMLAMKELDEP